MHLTKSYCKKSYLKVLKIPNGSCFYGLSAHEDTQRIDNIAEESSSEVAWPCEQLGKQKT